MCDPNYTSYGPIYLLLDVTLTTTRTALNTRHIPLITFPYGPNYPYMALTTRIWL